MRASLKPLSKDSQRTIGSRMNISNCGKYGAVSSGPHPLRKTYRPCPGHEDVTNRKLTTLQLGCAVNVAFPGFSTALRFACDKNCRASFRNEEVGGLNSHTSNQLNPELTPCQIDCPTGSRGTALLTFQCQLRDCWTLLQV